MVGANETAAAQFQNPGHALLQGCINSLAGGDAGFEVASVAHHVGVGEVHDSDIVVADGFHELIGYFTHAHLGLQVIGGHFAGRGNQNTVLTLELGFYSAVEEEGHMGILLGFSNAELLQPGLGDNLAQNVGELLLLEYNRSRVAGFVFGHGHVVHLGLHRAVESVEVLVDEGSGKLAGAVGAEVEEVHHVAIAHALLICFHKHGGFHELVCYAVLIALAGVIGRGAGAGLALTQNDGVPANLHTVPALVAVHGEESAHHGGNLRAVGSHGVLQLLQETGTALRVGVAAVHDGVDVDILHAGFGSNLHQADEVVDVGVHTAIGHKAHEVQAAAGSLGIGIHDDGILSQGTIVDSVRDAAEVLEHHAAGTQIQVAHLGVAHLPIRQTHVLAGGPQHHVRAGGQQFVGERSLGENGSIAGLIGGFRALRIAAPAVADDKYYRFICHAAILAAF